MKMNFKKTIILVLIVVSLSTFSAFASKENRSFSMVSNQNLFAEPFADPYNFVSTINVVLFPKKEQNSMKISCLLENKDKTTFKYENLKARDNDFSDSKYLYMKLAENVGLFRTRWESSKRPLDFELNLAGSLDTMFSISGGSCALAYDGAFMVAGTVRVADNLTVRAGIHHTSGHWGDEFLDSVYSYNKVNFDTGSAQEGYKDYATLSLDSQDWYLIKSNEYTRDNSWLFAVSGSPMNNLRVYGEAELPMKKSWVRPFIHARADITPVGEDFIRLGTSSGLNGTPEGRELLAYERNQKDANYKGWRIHGGAEYCFATKLGNAVVACDVQAHQDGQNKNHDILSYNAENKWEMEYTIGAGLIFKDAVFADRHFGIQAMYHIGRMPIAQMYYQRANLLYIGACIK